MTKPRIDENTTTTTTDMAATLGVTPRRLQQLATEGWIEGKTGRDQWNVFRTVGTFLSHCLHSGRKTPCHFRRDRLALARGASRQNHPKIFEVMP